MSFFGRRHYEEDLGWQFFENKNQAEDNFDFLFWKKLTYPASNRTMSTEVIDFDGPELIDRWGAQLQISLFGASDSEKSDAQSVEHRIEARLNGKFKETFSWIGGNHIRAINVPPGHLHSGKNRLILKLLPPKVSDNQPGRGRIPVEIGFDRSRQVGSRAFFTVSSNLH